MILSPKDWMNIRRFRVLHDAGATYAEIARECGVDWRTVRKYLRADAPAGPPTGSPRVGCQPQLITPLAALIESWVRADPGLRGTVIHERLVAEYGFTGHYQRVKIHLTGLRRALEADGDSGLPGLHRRFEVVPGAQAQVDWGDEGGLLAHVGIATTYSFHMVLSYSRDPFTCFTSSMDLATFWDCHRRAFAHFGGVPAAVVYDRTKTVVRRHVAPGAAVPLHPEAAAFAEHYGFVLDPLAAYRPTGKGRVERQVLIVREHVLAGRSFDSLAEMDGTFQQWLGIRRGQVHRTHGQIIAVRAGPDRAALHPLPALPYLVTDRYLRRVGKDALVSFDASLYSLPARRVRPGQLVEVWASTDTITIHQLPAAPGGPDADAAGGGAAGGERLLLGTHPRAARWGSWIVDPGHWDGLPDGHTRSTTVDRPSPGRDPRPGGTGEPPSAREGLLTRAPAARTPVARRSLAAYDIAAGLTPNTHSPISTGGSA